jgi:hypothetical protein
MIPVYVGQCSHWEQANIDLIIFQCLDQIGRIIERQVDLILDGTMLQPIQQWLSIQITHCSYPYFPFQDIDVI